MEKPADVMPRLKLKNIPLNRERGVFLVQVMRSGVVHRWVCTRILKYLRLTYMYVNASPSPQLAEHISSCNLADLLL